MRVLITGARGQLGQALQHVLGEHDVALFDLPELDVTDGQAVRRAVCEVRADIVLHCAAYTDVDGCARNPELAYRVNALGSQNVALACEENSAAMVHISTNEVFAGNETKGYEEWMPVNPINPYGCSKAAAEILVRSLSHRCYIVRTAWLYAPGGNNFVHAILERARTVGRLEVVVDEIANPTYVVDLARAIEQLIRTGKYGIYHFTNSGSCSRWAFANEILLHAGLRDIPNRPILGRSFQRDSTPPPYGALQNIAGSAIGITLRPWQEALAEYMSRYA